MRSSDINIGLLAHVDAGKTTLSEAVLYMTGSIRKLGRVDHRTAFLDNASIEQDRGITVFSKEARFVLGKKKFTLLDTPGHADFGVETERTLKVLDYAILIISGADGVQSHTQTLWKLLETYSIPVFIFVNKMDRPGIEAAEVLLDLREKLGTSLVEFKDGFPADYEEAAVCDEKSTEEYLNTGMLSDAVLDAAIKARRIFPVCFGSALKTEGVRELLDTVERYTIQPEYGDGFGAVVYKISRDKQGARQTHMKITGGSLRSRMIVDTGASVEKVDRIRIYSGKTFEHVDEAAAGTVCAVTGLSSTYAGQTIGAAAGNAAVGAQLEPMLTYRLYLPDGTDPVQFIQKLRTLEEEEPSLRVTWKEALHEIHVSVMGRLELEILQYIIKERFDVNVHFGEGSIIYKETIAKPAIGIGHFEPLRHYAEVQLLLSPLPRGSGLMFDTKVSEDELAGSWQRLILSYLQGKEHVGVLTGSYVTDMKITLLGGRSHLKHTESGDFRQATYRAVRQGLRKTQSILLEPMDKFRAEIPSDNVGRLLTDMQRAGASCEAPRLLATGSYLVTGRGPALVLQEYQQDVAAYTKGLGSFATFADGYDNCRNEQEVIESMAYDADSDIDNPTGSVFCSHGSGVYIDWDEVDGMAHVDTGYRLNEAGELSRCSEFFGESIGIRSSGAYDSASAGELEEIFVRTYGKSKRDEALRREHLSRGTRRPPSPAENFPQLKRSRREGCKPYMIVDGYNVIFAWEELKDLAGVNIDSAREELLEILENYRAYKKVEMVVVFDGYKVSGNVGSKLDYGDMKVVYTREAQTADRFIEETVYAKNREYDITVVTSDKPVQMAALGDGAARMSSREFYLEVINTAGEIRERLMKQRRDFNRPFEELLK